MRVSPRIFGSLAVVGLTALTFAPASADVAGRSVWPQFGRTATHPNNAPAETAFTPTTIGDLAIAWKGQVGNNSIAKGGAAVSGGYVYIGGTDGVLSVFDADGCGADVCQPVWKGVTENGIYSTPAVTGDLVLVGSADHFLYAFPASGCGHATCQPRWRGQMVSAALESSPAVVDGVAYLGDYSGRLYAFPVAGCGADICAPTWVGRGRGSEQIVSSPAVANGRVYVGTFSSTPDLVSGRMLVFSTGGCGLDQLVARSAPLVPRSARFAHHATCEPEWTARLRGPQGGNGAPLVSGDTVYIGSGTRFGEKPDTRKHLFAFPAAGCGAAACKPLRIYRTDALGVIGGPAIVGNTLFASVEATPDPNTVGVVAAYPADGCGHRRCDPLWTGVNQAAGFESPPALAGGLVMVAKGPASGFPVDAALYTFDANGCGGDVCRPLSFTQTGLEQNFSGAPLAVADATIFLPSEESAGPAFVYAFKVSP